MIAVENNIKNSIYSINNFISKRELEVLEYISFGFSAKEIAPLMFISEHTVKSHWKNLKLKLDARNTAAMIRIAFEQRILE